MKKTKKSPGSHGEPIKDKIRNGYRISMLTEGKQPSSVFLFCKSIGIKEEDFYNAYGSFEAIDKEIWKEYVHAATSGIGMDTKYGSLSVREKVLSFYFTLTEVLLKDRSFALLQLKKWNGTTFPPSFLKSFRSEFHTWLTPILDEGKQCGEIAKRPVFDDYYGKLLWLHLVFILQFWTRDDSAGFQNTDAVIEKSVNLAFDLMGNGVLDNAIDLGKFLYQTSKN